MYIPTKNELKIATIDVLKEKNSECTTEYINDQVALEFIRRIFVIRR